MNNINQKHVILTIGESHFVLPIKEFKSLKLNNMVSITLIDDSTIETNSNNTIMFTGSSDIINAMLETNENFYQPEKGKYSKVMMKRITKNEPFKQS